MIKKLFLFALTALMLAGCTDKKQEEKAVLNDILKLHDKVMSDDELLMKNKMQLDTLLLKNAADTSKKKAISAMQIMLTTADNAMGDWMQKFDPDYTGKSDNDIMAYMNSQKMHIAAIDSQINVAIDESNKYLDKLK